MSDFKELKAAYIALAGKNPPPMSTDALRARVDELKAIAAQQDPPAQDPPAQDPPAQDPPAQAPPGEQDEVPGADEQSVEDACAELGLAVDADGHCAVEIVTSVSGGINLVTGDAHRFEAAEAVRAVRAGIAKPRG